jgi:hypothetical protein
LAPPRKPLYLAHLTGAVAKNPQRYRARHEPSGFGPLGEPSEWLSDGAKNAWREMVPTMPWLNTTHRFIVEIAAILTAKMAAGELGVPGMQLLRVVLGKLGASPADFGRVKWAPPVEDDDDPAAEYFR